MSKVLRKRRHGSGAHRPATGAASRAWRGLLTAALLASMMVQGLAPSLAATPGPAASPPITAPQAYARASVGVVHVLGEATAWWYFFGLIPFGAEGAGAVIDPRGEILTNAHVIEDAQKVYVTLADGSRYPARILGRSVSHDVALLSIAHALRGRRIPALPMRDSATVRVGETVYAIGSPFGLRNSFSAGVVSSVYRRLAGSSVDKDALENVIQTDAAINPGNSGGALLDDHGRLIGLNTAIYSLSGGNDGVGFAIPINVARRIADDLRAYGRLKRPFLGVRLADELTPTLAKTLRLGVTQGLLVRDVRPGSPAALAGLRGGYYAVDAGERRILAGGDVIVRLNGRPAVNAARFFEAIEAFHPGDEVTLEIWRGERLFQRRVRLASKPSSSQD